MFCFLLFIVLGMLWGLWYIIYSGFRLDFGGNIRIILLKLRLFVIGVMVLFVVCGVEIWLLVCRICFGSGIGLFSVSGLFVLSVLVGLIKIVCVGIFVIVGRV